MRSSRTLTLTLLILSLLCFLAAPTFAAVEDPGNSGPPHDDDWGRQDKPSNGNWGSGQHPNGPMSGDNSANLWTVIFMVAVQQSVFPTGLLVLAAMTG